MFSFFQKKSRPQVVISVERQLARYVMGSLQGATPKMEEIGAIPFSPGNEAEISSKIGDQIRSRYGNSAETSLLLERGAVELRYYQVPSANLAELADMVRFQVARNLGGSAPFKIGFEQVDHTRSEALTSVLAANCPAEIFEVWSGANVSARRGLSAATARSVAPVTWVKSFYSQSQGFVLVTLGDQEADLVVCVRGKPAAVRSVRFADETDKEASETARAAALHREVLRTLAAAQQYVGRAKLENLFVLNAGGASQVILESMAEATDLQATLLDPWSACDASQVRENVSENDESLYSPVLAAWLGRFGSQPWPLDLMFEPAPVDKSSSVRVRWLAGIAGALGLAACVFVPYFQLSQLNADWLATKNAVEKADKELRSGQITLQRYNDLESFSKGKVEWLSELGRIGAALPPSNEVIVTETRADVTNQGSRITLVGSARQADAIKKIEIGLRDERHSVSGKGAQVDQRNPEYPWRFEETVSVTQAAPANLSAASKRDAREKADASNKSDAKDGQSPSTKAQAPRP